MNQLDYHLESAIVRPICRGDTEMVKLLLHARFKLPDVKARVGGDKSWSVDFHIV